MLELRGGDFLRARFAEPFDAIVCNPPYVRHHGRPRDEALLRRLEVDAGLRLSRLSNLYAWFLVRIWRLLAPAGRAAVITPAEWLNADFGAALKRWLLEHNAFDAIVQFDPAAAAFPGVLTTAAIFLLRRGRKDGEPVRLRQVRSADELDAADLGRPIAPDSLDPARKWSAIIARGGAAGAARAPLSRFARCVRGIATGANRYFVLTRSELRAFGIDRADVRLCISKAAQVRGDRLTAADLAALVAADERVFLLCPREPLAPAVRRYLRRGTVAGIDRRYLPAHRTPWYQPEERAAAPIWVNVFSRGGFRFVRNEAGALHLTAFHAIYPRAGVDADRLWRALCAGPTHRAIEREQRHYADGLCKLEPRDVERIELAAI